MLAPAPSYDAPVDGQLVDAVTELEAAVNRLADLLIGDDSFDIAVQTMQSAQSSLRKVEDQIHAARLVMLPVIEQAGLWATEYLSPGSFASWLTATENIMRSVANKEILQANHLRDDLPATRAAALNGDIGIGHVEAMVQFGPTTDIRKQALNDPIETEAPCNCEPDCQVEHAQAPDHAAPSGEEFLLRYSDAYSLGQFRRLVQRFAYVADPAADERGYNKAEEREYLNLSPTWGGWDIRGFLAEEHGQQLNTAINALLTNNITAASNVPGVDNASAIKNTSGNGSDSDDGASIAQSSHNNSGDSSADSRTPAQKRAAALADLARLTMDTGMLGGGAIEKRQLVINVSWTEFQKLQNPVVEPDETTGNKNSATDAFCAPANAGRKMTENDILDPDLDYASFGENNFGNSTRIPIPAAVLKRIACDSDIKRIVFGPEGQILDVGRTYRTVPAHIRTAVIARDKHCTFPGCDQPPERCEVHHAIRHWADGGETAAHNSALLCWHHHKIVDQTGITMRMDSELPPAPRRMTERTHWKFFNHHGNQINRTTPPPPGGLA